MTNKRYVGILSFLVCVLIGFICITFTSKNSFLFAFQDSRDIQIFLTTARGILDGDVLYRDIFEVKGPYLYVIYVLGLMIGRGTLLGVYFIEVLLFSVYLYLSYKIAILYVKNVPLCFLITAITGFLSTTTLAMDGGGQCEELLLPVLSVIVYVTLKYFKGIYPKRIPVSDVLLVSICFTIIFWMKYTMVGLVLGLILYLIYIQIKDKTVQNIPYYAGIFLLGVILTTLPIIIYFTYHNAWDSMWNTYFYKLIFDYKPDTPSNDLGRKPYIIFQEYISVSCFTAYAFIYSLIFTFRNNKEKRHLYGSICTMMLLQAIVMSLSRNWVYTSECMYAFNTLGLTIFILSMAEAIGFVRKKAPAIEKVLDSCMGNKDNMLVCIMGIIGLLLLINRVVYILPILFLVIFGMLFLYYRNNREKVDQMIKNWKVEYQEKRKTINVLVCIFGVALLAIYTKSFSKTSHAIGIPLEQYPQYKIAQYILDSDIENPILINYDTTDAGIYGFTNTKPPTKWVGDYNANFPEVEAMYEEYIGGQKADFVIAESAELELDGYQLVYSPGSTNFVHEGRILELFLYAKKD